MLFNFKRMLNYRWPQKAPLRVLYSSVTYTYPTNQGFKSSHPSHFSQYPLHTLRPSSYVPCTSSSPSTECTGTQYPVCSFFPFSVGCLSHNISRFFLKLPCSALVHTSSFLPWMLLYVTFVFPSPPSFLIPNQGTNSNATTFTRHRKMSRGGRGHSGSTAGSVKVPQLLPSPCQDTDSSVARLSLSTASTPAQ